MSQPVPPPPGDARVVTRADVTCVACGYRLEGLDERGWCPECGTPVERSLDFLEKSDPAHVARLRRGAILILAGILGYAIAITLTIVWIVFVVFTGAGRPAGAAGPFSWLANLVWIAPMLVGALGWWWLSSPDPDPARRNIGDSPRQFTRGALAAIVALTLIGLVASAWLPTSPGASPLAPLAVTLVAGILNIAAWFVWFFSSMRYFSWLGVRLPDDRVSRRARRFMWLGPVLVIVGALCFYIGPLIALAIYWNLLYIVWEDLRRISRRQDDAIGLR
jgi:hypothetical protein